MITTYACPRIRDPANNPVKDLQRISDAILFDSPCVIDPIHEPARDNKIMVSFRRYHSEDPQSANLDH